MFKLTLAAIEQYDEIREEFLYSKEQVLQLEHSLVSLSKWEAKWGKPFLSKDKKTFEESVDYIRCMTITQNVPDDAYLGVTSEHVRLVTNYIDAPMTATVIVKDNSAVNREVITAEIIYYWMIAHNIPLDCQKWHLNRLLTLINVCNIKSAPQKRMSRKETLSRNAAQNAARRAKLNSKG